MSPTQKSKEEKIEEVKSKLPLPEQPRAASDWQSFDARITGVGSGSISSDEKHSTTGLRREPATQSSEEADMSDIGWNAKKMAKSVNE